MVDGLHAVRAMARNMGNCGAANYREAIAFWNAVVVAYTTCNDTVFPEGYEEWRSPTDLPPTMCADPSETLRDASIFSRYDVVM